MRHVKVDANLGKQRKSIEIENSEIKEWNEHLVILQTCNLYKFCERWQMDTIGFIVNFNADLHLWQYLT